MTTTNMDERRTRELEDALKRIESALRRVYDEDGLISTLNDVDEAIGECFLAIAYVKARDELRQP